MKKYQRNAMNILKTILFIGIPISIGLTACTTGEGNRSDRTEEKKTDGTNNGIHMGKARSLVAKMTLEEKIAQLHGAAPNMVMTDKMVAELFEKAKKDPSLLLMPRRVDSTARLNIPTMRFVNGPSGVGTGDLFHNYPQQRCRRLLHWQLPGILQRPISLA